MTEQQELSPHRIVEILDANIIGQQQAKRAVAIAFRNRWRRLQIEDPVMQDEITPKNILMIGPTGVGKTEIARRLAKLSRSPFIKVEATKFTEVGYVGRDVESIIRDLMEAGVKMARSEHGERAEREARAATVAKLVRGMKPIDDAERRKLELRLEAGEMDDKKIKVKVKPPPPRIGMNITGMDSQQGIEELGESIRSMLGQIGSQNQRAEEREMAISDAYEHLLREEVARRINEEAVKAEALRKVEQSGIVFIDEIDKIANSSAYTAGEVSRQGVQRDLLPLIEGTVVQTKYGPVSTSHILFIGAGAFHYSRPSDMVPELQGRLPVKVRLAPLTPADFVSILKDTEHNLIKQYQTLLATENVTLRFADDAIKRIAEIASAENENEENIGARRLHAIMERLVEAVSFDSEKLGSKTVTFSTKKVDEILNSADAENRRARAFI